MLIEYETFLEKLNDKIKSGEDFYVELLKNIIKNPNRYCGIFRLTNIKTKLLQNVTQSHEIKFGDFMEEILTEYIGLLGYENLPKVIGKGPDGNDLNADQFFKKENNLYLVEQKVRDDHDSTKKRGQYENFYNKVKCIRQKYPKYHVIAVMWFIDDTLKKNRKFYYNKMKETYFDDCKLKLCYGGEFFDYLDAGDLVWDEIVKYLSYRKKNTKDEEIVIPDFGNSEEIYEAMLKLPYKEYKKLFSEAPQYKQLREELFEYGDNLEKVKKNRPL